MGPLTDIQDNIEKLRSLQESLHDLCTFISTLDLTSGAKEDTLLQGIADLKNAFANIDLFSLEATLVSGLNEIKDAVSNIDFTDLENSIGEVKDAVANIDFSALAQEVTLTQGIQAVKDAITAIPATDLTTLEQAVAETAKDTTLNNAKTEIITAVNNAKPEIDTSAIAKQGENTGATNTAILAEIKAINDLKNIYSVRFEQNQDGDNTYTMVLPLVAGIVGDTIVM